MLPDQAVHAVADRYVTLPGPQSSKLLAWLCCIFQVIKSLQDRQALIVPLKMRNLVQKHPVPVEALCSYTEGEVSASLRHSCRLSLTVPILSHRLGDRVIHLIIIIIIIIIIIYIFLYLICHL